MATFQSRESFIPLRLDEVIDVLASEPNLSAIERDGFRRVCRMIRDIVHHWGDRTHEKLKIDYSPFDPDTNTRSLISLTSEERQRRLDDLFDSIASLLQKAGYRQLNSDDLESASRTCSRWGLDTDVDFQIFERLAIFARGAGVEKRPLRLWRRFGKVEEVEVPIYPRLVMAMKLRPHPRLGRQVDPARAYFQLFKNVPQLDVNMLLPGARARMSRMDRGRIGLPLLGGMTMAAWQVGQDLFRGIFHVINDMMPIRPRSGPWPAARLDMAFAPTMAISRRGRNTTWP